MAVVPAESTLVAEDSAVSLPRYAQIVQSPECAFYGVRHAGDAEHACRYIWSKHNRDLVRRYLAEAQEEIEDEVGFFLMPRWIVGAQTDGVPERQIDQQVYGYPVKARWGQVIEAGVRATAAIASGAAVSHVADPATVGPLVMAGTGITTDTTEVRVYHPGTEVEIHPSVIAIAGVNLTITIPRCRMVLASLADNPDNGIAYTNVLNFEQTVDVVREYNNPSINATLIWPHSCTASACGCTCGEFTQAGCIYVNDPVTGLLDVLPATYSAGAWSTTSAACCSGNPALVRLNYRAGVRTLTRQQEDAIIRLAHTKMPEEPCGCEVAQRLWARDRRIPDVLTREQLNCPFGTREGAWAAWRFAQTFRLLRGMTL